MRTYRREDYLAAKHAWQDFGPEWGQYRQLAAEQGMLYPPSGSGLDSPDDAEPSQRAIIYRALEDTPRALGQIIRASRSWSDVVRKLMADVDRRREDATITEAQAEWDRSFDMTPRESTQILGNILTRVRDSLP